MTRYLAKALAGERSTTAEWNEHLVAFHRAYGGVTEMLSALHTSDGKTSYDVLASRIEALAPDACDILDLGCGDGVLLARLAARYSPDVALTGIDLSETDIARARQRLPRAVLLAGDALQLDMDQKSQDVVTSHLVFMAVPEVSALLQRAYRCLRDRGVLVFVVEDPLAGGTMFSLLADAVATMRNRFPSFEPSVPNREPMERESEMGALLERTGFSNVSVEPFHISGRLSAEQLWDFVERSYPFGLLDAALRDDLHMALQSYVERMVRDSAESLLALRLVTAFA